MEPEKSSYMQLLELNAQVPGKLTLSSSSPTKARTKDGIMDRATVDYRTKVRSWLIHEDQNMSTRPPLSTLPSTTSSPIVNPDSQTSNHHDDTAPVRQSKRRRIQPVEFWNNETVIYDDDGTLRAVEKSTACFESIRNKENVKSLTKEKKITKKNTSIFRKDTEINVKKIRTEKTENSKVVNTKSKTNCEDKKKKKEILESSNERKNDKTETKNKNTNSPLAPKKYDEKKSKKNEKPELESIPLPSIDPDMGLRRGKRQRIKPVAFWDNDIAQYDDDGNLLGITHVGAKGTEKENKTHIIPSVDTQSVFSNEALSSEPSSSNSETQKKANKKVRLSITALAKRNIPQKRGRKKKSTNIALSEYPFNQLNKDNSFTLGRILEVTDKNGTIRKLSPIKEANKFRTQPDFQSKENTTKKQEISNKSVNEKATKEQEISNNVNEKATQSDVQEMASKESAQEVHSSPSTGNRRRSTRSRIAPVEFWNSQFVQYKEDGTLEGVEDWMSKRVLKTPVKESTNDNGKEKLPISSEVCQNDQEMRQKKLFSPNLNILEEAATSDESSRLSRRRLFEPNASSAANSRASNAHEEMAATTFSVQVHSIGNKGTSTVLVENGNKDVEVPEGWKRTVVMRTIGKFAGRFEVIYYSPAGKRFRSKAQIEKYCEKEGLEIDLGIFKFVHKASAEERALLLQKAGQTTNRDLNIIDEGISALPLTPIVEEASNMFDCTGNSAPLSHKNKSKSPIMTWLRKETLKSMINEKKSGRSVKDPNHKGKNNGHSEMSQSEVGESNVEADCITDFETPTETLEDDAEELRLTQTTKQLMSPKDNLGKAHTGRPVPKLTPYQIMQKEIEEFQLNASLRSPQTNDNVKTTISFVAQKVDHLGFNAPWATPASKQNTLNFEGKSKKVSKVQGKKDNHRHNNLDMINKSTHRERIEENSPLLKTMHKVSNEQNARSAQIRLQSEAPASKCAEDSNLPMDAAASATTHVNNEANIDTVNTDVALPDANVSVDSDASANQHVNKVTIDNVNNAVALSENSSVTESLEAYVKNTEDCTDANVSVDSDASVNQHVNKVNKDNVNNTEDCTDTNSQSISTVPQDEPECSGGELNSTAEFEKESHEFYPITDPTTGLTVCHMAQSVAHKEMGIYTAFISIQKGEKGIKTWEITENSVVFVIEGTGYLYRTLKKRRSQVSLKPNRVVNLVQGEMVTLSNNGCRSDETLIVMFIKGGTSIECPELEEALQEQS